MDFGSLLHVAQKNEKKPKNEIKYYSTKFDPPKKEERSKQLSDNIKKFLARKEAEEKQKAIEAQVRREELLALRSQDRKATRRVSVMLKRTKSANKSVISDAIDNDNTAVTLAGPSQPDEDDYGYVSQEASAFYNKMMQKYNTTPDEDKFNKSKKNTNTNLKEIKDRVRAAILKEQEEALLPHKRKRRPKEDGGAEEEDDRPELIEKKDKPKARPAPPPLNFNDLLKIAEKKQFEPIKIETKVVDREERLMTKKQKREFEKEQAWKERKEKGVTDGQKMPPPNKIPKLTPPNTNSNTNGKIPKLNKPIPKKPDERISTKPITGTTTTNIKPKPPLIKKQTTPVSKLRTELEKNRPIPTNKPSISKPLSEKNKPQINTKPSSSKQLPPQDIKPKKFPPSDIKPKQFPPSDLKPKQFPPPDTRPKFAPKSVKRKPPMGHKRRILDDDDSEYDSEMDDFIDDGPEGQEDYSKYISEIFGYDKSRYRNVNEDFDDAQMESSFSQVMREEFVSGKLGLMEDLEDMKLEAEEKKRKALMKKKMMRK